MKKICFFIICIMLFIPFIKVSAQIDSNISDKSNETTTNTETTKEDVINGYNKLKKACEIIQLPIIAIGVDEKLNFESKYDNVDVWTYKRMMPRAFW